MTGSDFNAIVGYPNRGERMTLDTLTINAQHIITTWIESHAMIPYAAHCSCSWHAASISAGLRDWNVDGHVSDVRKSVSA